LLAASDRRSSLRLALVLALAAAALYAFAASRRDFWAPDEPDFAEHVREMNERRDWLLPYENGRPYSEKPILFYWLVAATTPFTGGDVSPFATRLPSVVGGAFLVFGAAWLAGRSGGPREALVAGALTAVCPIAAWQAQFLQIDALFTALVFAALLLLVRLEDAPSGRLRLLLYVVLALAVLAKGPLALALVGLVLVVRAVLRRSAAEIVALDPVRGALVFLVLVIPWYAAAAAHGGTAYAYDLIVNQNWNRFFHAFDHQRPWWFYLESIWTDFFPFTLLALLAPFAIGKEGFASRRDLRFAALVASTAFLFLSISGSKQGKYLLVAYPFAAVLAAAGIGAAERKNGRALVALRLAVLLAALLILGTALTLPSAAAEYLPRYASLAPLLSIPLAVGAVGAVVILLRRRSELAAAVLAVAATLAAGEAAAAAVVLPAIDVAKTGRPFYARIAPRVSHGEPLAYYDEAFHSYAILALRRRVTHIKTERELARWLRETPGALVLVDGSTAARLHLPETKRLRVLDRQPVGQDEILLLASE